MTKSLLNNPPMQQNVNKPLGHLSPSMMAWDLEAINKHLTTLGAPIINSESNQLGDIRARLFWLVTNADCRKLEQVKDEN